MAFLSFAPEKSGLVQAFKNTNQHLLLIGEGGIGKSTHLQMLYAYLLQQENHIPIFIDAKLIREDRPLIDLIWNEYCGNIDISSVAACEQAKTPASEKDVLEAVLTGKTKYSKEYTFVLIIDGINELNYSLKARTITKVKEWLGNPKLRFVISSRVKEDFVKDIPDFSTLSVKPLSEEKIRNYIKNRFDIDYTKEINESLISILRIPLYLNVFGEVYSKANIFPNLHGNKVVRKAQLLSAYIDKLKADAAKKEEEQEDLIDFVLSYWLPKVAFDMVAAEKYIVSDDYLYDYYSDPDNKKIGRYFRSLCSKKKDLLIAFKRAINSEDIDIIQMCEKDFAFFVSGEDFEYEFSHQIWRDYFAASHVVNLLNCKKIDELEKLTDNNVMRFVGEMYCKDVTDFGTLCECDYENKQTIEDARGMSPIEEFIQDNCVLLNQNPMTIRILINIMKRSRKYKLRGTYFKGLDLKFCSFIKCDIRNADFELSRVYRNNFLFSKWGCIHNILSIDNGKKIVTSNGDGTLNFFDANSLSLLYSIHAHNSPIQSVVMLSENTIISGGNDGIIKMFDINNGKQIDDDLNAHTAEICSMAISPDRKVLVSSGNDNKLIFWNLKNKQKRVINAVPMKKIVFYKERTSLISLTANGEVHIWTRDREQDNYSSEIIYNNNLLTNIDLSLDNSMFVFSGLDRVSIVFLNNKIAQHYDNLLATVVKFSLDSKYLIVGSFTGSIYIIDIERKTVKGFPAHNAPIFSLEVRANGILFSGDVYGNIKKWDLFSGEFYHEFFVPANYGNYVITRDKELFFFNEYDRQLKRFDINLGRLKECYSFSFMCSELFYLENENYLALVSSPWEKGERKIIYWDINAEKIIKVFPSAYNPIKHISEIESFVAIDVRDNSVVFINETDCKIKKRFRPNNLKDMCAVCVVPSCDTIIIGGKDGTIRLFNVDSEKQIGEKIVGHAGEILDIVMINEHNFITYGKDKSVRFWNISGECETISSSNDTIENVETVTVNNHFLAVAKGEKNSIYLMNLYENNTDSLQLDGNLAKPYSIALTNEYVISLSDDDTLRFWNLKEKKQNIMYYLNPTVINCNFSNAIIEDKSLYRILYSNGAVVPDEYIPKPLPFGATGEED